MSVSPHFSQARRGWSQCLIATAVLLCSILYVSFFTYRGWIPHDEGLLGQAAERTLAGEIPHIDFDDPYSGGLSYLHALSFRMSGARLSSMRIPLLVFAALALIVIYFIARRVMSLMTSLLVVIASVGWSLPNYFAPLPSWYNLFLSLFGTWALIRYHDAGKRRWLVLAGVFGGLSILVKITGLYFVAAAFLFLISETFRSDTAGDRSSNRRTPWISACLAFPLVLITIALLSTRFDTMVLIHFLLPVTVLCTLLMRMDLSGGLTPPAQIHRAAAVTFPFALGVLAPITIFLIPYAIRGAMRTWVDGVAVNPQIRMTGAAFPLPPVWTLAATFLFLLPLGAALRWKGTLVMKVTATASAIILMFGYAKVVYRGVWFSIRPLVPALMILGAFTLWPRETPGDVAPKSFGITPRKLDHDAVLFLLLSVLAFSNLIQYPYSFGIYFCYSAPIAILVAGALINRADAMKATAMTLLLFYTLFGFLWLNSGDIRAMGMSWLPADNRQLLVPARGNLRVSQVHKEGYERIVQLITSHSRPRSFIYAGPDCPEIYFLSRRRNPTRIFYEFLSKIDATSTVRLATSGKGARRITVVVVNTTPEFSAPIDATLYAQLRQRYPAMEKVGPFEVLWNDRAE